MVGLVVVIWVVVWVVVGVGVACRGRVMVLVVDDGRVQRVVVGYGDGQRGCGFGCGGRAFDGFGSGRCFG